MYNKELIIYIININKEVHYVHFGYYEYDVVIDIV